MVSKKKKKVILISIISLTLIAVILCSYFFIFKNKIIKNNNPPPANQVSDTFSNSSNKAIANGEIPTNYNGTYKLLTLDLEFSENLNYQEKEALLNNKGVSDLNALKDKLKAEKIKEINSNGELLVLYNGNINKTNGIKNPKPVLNSAGKYIGDDNLSIVTITKTGKQFYMSLNYNSKENAINISQSNNEDGTKLYIFDKIYSKYDPELILINITYTYEIYVIEDNFDEKIYDF